MFKGYDKVTTQADLFGNISEPHETHINAFVTFPRYDLVAHLLHLYYHQEIQDGGHKCNFVLNSHCMQDSCIIPTAVSMFSRSRNSIKLLSILCGASGSSKSKMSAHKQEIRINQPVYKIAAQF